MAVCKGKQVMSPSLSTVTSFPRVDDGGRRSWTEECKRREESSYADVRSGYQETLMSDAEIFSAGVDPEGGTRLIVKCSL